MAQAIDAADGSGLIVRQLTVHAAQPDNPLHVKHLGGVKHGVRVTLDIEVRLIANEDDQPAFLIASVIEFVAPLLQRLGETFIELHHRANEIVRAGYLEQIKTIRPYFPDFLRPKLLDDVLW